MHALAEALRAAGVTAYVLDIRGHGGSGQRGDIDYIGQLDDDLSDFVTQLGPARRGETRTLVGFSAGAGFTIRFAGGRYGELFDRYVFLAPIFPGAPTLRQNAGGWTNIALPRIIAIAKEGINIRITWTTGGGLTNFVQATNGAGNGSYSNNFTSISGPLFVPGFGLVSTNYFDSGGATNKLARYYRVRLVP